MADGVIYKYNATTFSESQAKKFNASAISDGRVRHANATTWFDNYPMEREFTETFPVSWTHGYNGAGAKLDEATWGNHPRSGDSVDFKGVWGFDRTAMRNFVADGRITLIQLKIKFIDPSHAGNPSVWFAPHTVTSKPTQWNEANVNTSYQVKSIFYQTGSDIVRTITFSDAAWMGGNLAGFRADGTTAAGDSARFAGTTTSHGVNAYTSQITIRVIK
jgi:curved DNA-binding protein CbpA